MGLVDWVLPVDEVVPAALGYAGTLAREVSPTSVATMKRQLRADLERGLVPAAREAIDLTKRMVTEADFLEALAAHGERRSPRFSP